MTPQKHAGQAITIGGGRSAVEMVWRGFERDGMVCKSALGRIRVRGCYTKMLAEHVVGRFATKKIQ